MFKQNCHGSAIRYFETIRFQNAIKIIAISLASLSSLAHFALAQGPTMLQRPPRSLQRGAQSAAPPAQMQRPQMQRQYAQPPVQIQHRVSPQYLPQNQYQPPSQFDSAPQGVVPIQDAADHSNGSNIQMVQDTGRITRKPLPTQIRSTPGIFDEMEIIIRRSQLIITNSRIRRYAIADPSIIEFVTYSPTEISIVGLEMGTTTLTLWFEGDDTPITYLVHTIQDPSLEGQRRIDYGKLERKIAVLFPNSKVYLIPLSRKIIVKGEASDATEAANILSVIRGEVINYEGNLGGPQPVGAGAAYGGGYGAGGMLDGIGNNGYASSFIVNMLEIPGEFQVMIHVTIAQMNRTMMRQLGVDLSVLFDGGRQFLGSSMGGIPSTLTGIFEAGEVNVLINALAQNGTTKIMARPTLTVLSGHSASFLAGGEFAVPTIVGVGGAQGTSTTFRGFGTSIVVTPIVIDKDLIRMRIVPEYSQINDSNSVQGIPGLNSRRAQTTVELREGQTIVLAGLFGHDTSTGVTRIPWLGEIPLVGSYLFSSKQSSQGESELLITVTPQLVRPMEEDEVPPYPGFEVTVPADKELYKYAMTEGAPDTAVYQLQPYGRGAGQGIEVGYQPFNPAPASPYYPPANTGTYQQGAAAQPIPQHRSSFPAQPVNPQVPAHTNQHQPLPPPPAPAASGPHANAPGQYQGAQTQPRSGRFTQMVKNRFQNGAAENQDNSFIQPAGYIDPKMRRDSAEPEPARSRFSLFGRE
ncbi:pilus assembly protein N-terminal domain-containing protein [Gimesia sp.]|mgnify:CR=1 FL=1|uniref:type II and III secretion system protein family protein n=1 Tax=Gimesia sp. TaxID=2024833 RepID=UPI000C53725F|nr:pilus assembly protein N-terminal domain-containing protein [Gimesia sp.]MAX38002.1 type II and III secretion system protein [Gimesia sp.]|tara:strand:+ start:13900 stop:16143 length:2244 start_codon:yes stop_codon:yes gene_type:complete